MYDRRRYIRISEESQISYRVLPKAKSDKFLAKNISQGGIRFLVGEIIPRDALIEISVTLKKIPFSFKAIAKVRWVRKELSGHRHEVGAEFVNIPEKASTYLINYIRLVSRHM